MTPCTNLRERTGKTSSTGKEDNCRSHRDVTKRDDTRSAAGVCFFKLRIFLC